MEAYYDEEMEYYEGDYEDGEHSEQSVNPSSSGPMFPEGTTLIDIYDTCLQPTFIEAFHQVVYILCACLIFRLNNQYVPLSRQFHHFASFLIGAATLFLVAGNGLFSSSILVMIGYLIITRAKHWEGYFYPQMATFALLGYLVTREYSSLGLISGSWEQVRGTQMIMVMKILSICFDVCIGERTAIPSYEVYLGYLFCPANLIFGPWISFDIYCKTVEGQSSKIHWLLPALGAAICSFLSLGVSSCMLYWVFLGSRSRWILTVQDAMSVRFSHYFISFLAELCCLLGGFTLDSVIAVTEPWKIEFPRSLVDVVISWNKPMHRWLRTYVFRPAMDFGIFKAVLWTFMVSSMLHGLNFGLTSVLLSLGFYTYVEHTLRDKLAVIFDACVKSRKCPATCGHKYKSDDITVTAVNLGFGILAFCNLAYLGVMMSKTYVENEAPKSTSETIYEDISKWSNLGFFSHWTMFFMYLASSTL